MMTFLLSRPRRGLQHARDRGRPELPVRRQKVPQDGVQRIHRVAGGEHGVERLGHAADLLLEALVVPGDRQAKEHHLAERGQHLVDDVARLPGAQVHDLHLEARGRAGERGLQPFGHGDDVVE
jgi:hypothetical protein